ncbi:MAG: NAD-dependent epimerase/dehydratase family protein, partial [Myxococcota bacterium]|nr:NAD-dependent epimerase/dehydratase family protein [Myxococcota bacterium]
MADRVFVTGASGRVGRRLVASLLERGDEVVGLSRSEERAGQVRALGASCRVGDLENPADWKDALEGVRTVFHLAGGVRGAGDQTPERLNRDATEGLLRALEGHSLDALVFTSTVAVYGDRSGLWVDETMPTFPNTRYGHSKVQAEDLFLSAHEKGELPVRLVRLAAVYGPDFPILMVDPMLKGRAWLPGEGRNIVPMVHVEDAVAGLLAVGDRGQDGAVYNLSDREPVDLRTFYGSVHRLVGGQAVRFWSTWVPSRIQFALAGRVERWSAAMGRYPRVTPDTLRLFTASVRMKIERMENELGF